MAVAERTDLFSEKAEVWRLVSIDGEAVGANAAVSSDPFYFFGQTQSGSVFGRDGCNYWSGRDDGEIMSTLALCDSAEMAKYDALTGALRQGAIGHGASSPATVQAGGHTAVLVREED